MEGSDATEFVDVDAMCLLARCVDGQVLILCSSLG